MEIVHQLSAREQGKRLIELGVTAKSKFVHALFKTKNGTKWVVALIVGERENPCLYVLGTVNGIQNPQYSMEVAIEVYPAYSVSELGLALYPALKKGLIPTLPNLDLVTGEWNGCFGANQDHGNWQYETEADARCSYLIYCLENNLIAAEAVNYQIALS